MSHILLISGIRPEIILLAPAYHALRQVPWARVRSPIADGQAAARIKLTLAAVFAPKPPFAGT